MPASTSDSVPGAVTESVPRAGSSAAPCPATRLQHGISKRKIYTYGNIPYGKFGLFTHTGEPQHLDEALKTAHWKEAMDDEYATLQKNQTWRFVPPQG
jgi:hypothetical protein